MSRSVVITGVGALTPIGNSREDFWDSLVESRCGIKHFDKLDTLDIPVQKAGFIDDFKAGEHIEGINFRRLPRFSQFIIASVDMAIKDSGIRIDSIAPEKRGLIFNTINGPVDVTIKFLETLYLKGPQAVSPLKFAQTVMNAAAAPISIKNRLEGMGTVTSGLSSIITAYEYVKDGRADMMVAGGADAFGSNLDVFKTCSNHKMLATKNGSVEEGSRPADVLRNGNVMGEGAGMVVLESKEQAISRGATIYAEIVGYGITHDNNAVKKSNERTAEPIEKAVEFALQDAKITSDEIHYINALANSSVGIDYAEAVALRNAFPNILTIPVSTYKGHTGEISGAGDALGVIQTALSIKYQKIAPICGLKQIDPECGLNYVRTAPKSHDIHYALSNSMEVGGNTQAIILKHVN